MHYLKGVPVTIVFVAAVFVVMYTFGCELPVVKLRCSKCYASWLLSIFDSTLMSSPRPHPREYHIHLWITLIAPSSSTCVENGEWEPDPGN